jgi:parvulin-like peptidyl-prolyl isomerase
MSLLALALALAAGAPEPVVAEVNGEAITAARLRARFTLLRAQGNAATPDAAFETLVSDVVASAEARARGLHKDPTAGEVLEEERRRLAGELLVSRDLGAIQPTEAQLLELFHQSGDSVHLRQVSFLSEADAKAALARIAKGGDLATEARASVDPQARSTGGDVGTRTRMNLPPALAAVVFTAPLKQVQGPIALDAGFALYEVVERTLADESAFPPRREALRAFAVGQFQKATKGHLVEQLRKKHGVTLDEAFLQKMGIRLDATPEEAAYVLAKVGGRPLRYGEVLSDVQALARGQAGSHASGGRIKIELAKNRLDKMVIEAEALARGLGAAPEIQAALWQYEQAVLARALDVKLRAEVARPSPAEIEDYYRRRGDEWAHAAHRPCSHILFESRGEAVAARKRLGRGEKFEELAKAESGDKASALRGGSLGEIGDDRLEAMLRAGNEVALARALKDAPAGQVSEPVESGLGWHLVRCGPRSPPVPRKLEEVREQVVERMVAERGEKAATGRLAQLRAAARLRVDKDALARVAADFRS